MTGTCPGGNEKAFSLDMSRGRFGHEVGRGKSVAPAEQAQKTWPGAHGHLPIGEVRLAVLPFSLRSPEGHQIAI